LRFEDYPTNPLSWICNPAILFFGEQFQKMKNQDYSRSADLQSCDAYLVTASLQAGLIFEGFKNIGGYGKILLTKSACCLPYVYSLGCLKNKTPRLSRGSIVSL
jgi:hypothetical protein